jgi:hypothetical protein
MKINLTSSDSEERFSSPLSSASESESSITIESSKGDKTYIVRLKNGIAMICNCPGFEFRGTCRHIKEVNGNE